MQYHSSSILIDFQYFLDVQSLARSGNFTSGSSDNKEAAIVRICFLLFFNDSGLKGDLNYLTEMDN